MMNMRTDDELDQIFIEFAKDRETVQPAPLGVWIEKYPDMKLELIAWATELPTIKAAEAADPEPLLEQRTVEIGQSVLRKFGLLQEEAPKQIVPLYDLAKARGITPKQFALNLGIGVSIAAKLNRRLIQVASIPDKLIERIADQLQVGAEQVRAFLALPPTLSHGAAYRSQTAPEAGAAEEFLVALQTSPDTAEQDKQFWISEATRLDSN